MQRTLSLLALCITAATASADTLVLANGDELTCTIVEWAVDHVVVEHPQLGRVHLSLDQLKLDTGERPNPGLFGTGFLRGWKRRFDLGLEGEEGNSVSTTITAGMDFSYRDDWTRWRVLGRYFYDRDDGAQSDNNLRLDIRRDWLLPDSRWFLAARTTYQFDRMESWRHRTVTTLGPGVHLVQKEAHELDLLVAPAFTREFGDSDSSQMEAFTGLDYTWTISERQTFEIGNNVYYEISPDGGAIRNFTRARWSVSLLERPALSLNLGVDNEYESRPLDEDESNNLTYFVSLGIDL